MKIAVPEINGVSLPENLKWITVNNHPFKDLISREISAIEEEITHLELVKKTIFKKRKEEEKELAVVSSLFRATESSLKDPSSKRFDLFKRLKKGKQEKKDQHSHGKKTGNKKTKAKDEESEEEGDESNEDEHEEGEENKKRKYVILVKKCQCCGLEVKRHNCKHTVCSKPCSIEEKQVSKKKGK